MSGSTRGQQETCPFLGLHWDRSIRGMYPDLENRCFARFQKSPFLLLFASKRLGGHVDLARQRAACYGDYRQCEDYQKKRASWRERPAGECRGK